MQEPNNNKRDLADRDKLRVFLKRDYEFVLKNDDQILELIMF